MAHVFATRKGRKVRRAVLLRDEWTCRFCGCLLREGRTHPRSATVDHLEPVELSPEKALDPENLWSSCKHCHDTTCASIEAKYDTAEEIKAAKLRYQPVGLDGYRRTQCH